MSDEEARADEEVADVSSPRRKNRLFERLSSIGSSAQAAIPGMYAWSITVAPAAWSRGSMGVAKVASVVGVIALVTAPLVENASKSSASAPDAKPARFTPESWARMWSVWGFVLSSAIVWALVPTALSAAKLDPIRGALGIVGWALFAFASAGPSLRPDPESEGRIVAGTLLKPRSELPRGDGLYVATGIVLALGMQVVGWGVAVPERAVLVRLVTVACGIAVVGGTTSIALARHGPRKAPSRALRIRRALPWVVLLLMIVVAGLALTLAR